MVAKDSTGARPIGATPPRAWLDLEDDRDRAVVDELDLHPRAEAPVATGTPSARRARAEALVERLRDLGRARRPRSSGRFPFAVSAISVNWLTTSDLAAGVEQRAGRTCPPSFSKTRSRATLPAMRSASASVSPAATPSSTSKPATAGCRRHAPSTDAGACCTRCTTARMRDCRTNSRSQPTSLISVSLPADRRHVEAAREPVARARHAPGPRRCNHPRAARAALAEKRANPTSGSARSSSSRDARPARESRASSPSSTSSSSSTSTSRSIETEAALLLPENLARRYRAIPVRFLEDGSVLVAVADPTNVMFSDDLRLALGVPVRVCVASPDAIELAITTHPRRASSRSRRSSPTRRRRRTTHGSRPRPRDARRRLRQQDDLRRRSTSAPRTSTSRRSSGGSTSASGSTASCASSPRSPARRRAP